MVKHKILLGGFLSTLMAFGFFAVHSLPARAEDSGDDNISQQTVRAESTSNSDDEKLKQEDEEIDNEVENEHGLEEHLSTISVDVTSSVPEVTPSELNTYGDVSKALQTYSQALDQIIAQNDVTSTVSGLTDKEQNLLDSLIFKHNRNFSVTVSRAKEIKSQINEISAALAPLADQSISPLLKKFVVSSLNDLKDEIRSLGNLENMNFDILELETSN